MSDEKGQLLLTDVMKRACGVLTMVLVITLFCVEYLFKSEYSAQPDHQLNQQEVKSRTEDEFVSEQTYSGKNKQGRDRCRERVRNVAYIKTSKTGSSTVTNLMYRAALKYNLTALVYTNAKHPIHKYISPRAKHSKFNTVMEHIEYDNEELRQSMFDDVIYVTSLRHPFNRLKSSFNFQSKRQNRNLNEMLHLEEDILTSEDTGAWYVRVPKELEANPTKMKTFIREILGRFFKVVLITEYFDESLVLLRRRLCWDLQDIVYYRMKMGIYSYKDKEYLPQALQEHKKLMAGEYAMYNYFNNSLWTQINEESDDFWEELEHFREINQKVTQFCERIYTVVKTQKRPLKKVLRDFDSLIQIPESEWNERFSLSSADCVLMALHKYTFRTWFAVKQNPELCDMSANEGRRKAEKADKTQDDPNYKLHDNGRRYPITVRHVSHPRHFVVSNFKKSAGWTFSFNTNFCNFDTKLPYGLPLKAFSKLRSFDLVVY